MANKQLTAKVKLNITDAESKLKRLDKLFRALNQSTNNVGRNNQINKQLTQSQSKVQNIVSKVKSWASNQRQVTSATKSTNSLLTSIGGKLKAIAATYLGVMGAKTALGTTDIITASQNKLNYVNANNLGVEGDYDSRVFTLTQNAMDKMYVSSQKVRMSYTDMMSNVSKIMALAGDSFDNNTDYAIRFQEIMAKAYTVGGASAQEMSTSMYQLTQALGAGILAGDELRSVREGAPLAYKAIEKFAQKIYNCKDSLKDMASEGKITSDIVVAGIMNAGDAMDSAFAQTQQTFGQTWDQIKNTAVKAFEPVAKMFNEALNKALDTGIMYKFEDALIEVSKGVQIAFKVISDGIKWIYDNWTMVESWLVSGLITIGVLITYNIIAKLVEVIALHWKLILITAAIFLIVWAIYAWRNGMIEATDAIATCLNVLAVAFIVLFIITGSWVFLILAVIALVAALFFNFTQEVCGYFWVAATWIGNLIQDLANIITVIIRFLCYVVVNLILGVVNIIFGIIDLILGCFFWFSAEVVNCVVGLVNGIVQLCWAAVDPIVSIIEWILNACNGGFNSFGDAVANLLGQICSWFLSLGKIVTKIIDAIFGTDWTSGLSSLQDSVLSWGKNEKSITIDRNAPELERIDATDAFATGFGTLPNNLEVPWSWVEDGTTVWGTGLEDWNWKSAYDEGAAWGAGANEDINNWINAKLGKYMNTSGESDYDQMLNEKLAMKNGTPLEKPDTWLDKLGDKLGLDFGDLANGLPDIKDPTKELDKYNPPSIEELMESVGNIDDNTSGLKDSMDLADDDLDYLRKIAEMEWRNEFTTAEIKVDMTNHNTVNGERDLDGIVEYLSDVLREEMTSVAYGVHY